MTDHEMLLRQWNDAVTASGSRTHGGAVGRIAQLRRIANLAAACVQNPAWGGVCDEDVDLESALRENGFLGPSATRASGPPWLRP